MPQRLFVIPIDIIMDYYFWCFGRGGVAAGQEEKKVVLIQPLLMDGAGLLRVESEIVALGSDHKEIKGVGLEFFFLWKRCLDFYGKS
jgi:hypothetical protein